MKLQRVAGSMTKSRCALTSILAVLFASACAMPMHRVGEIGSCHSIFSDTTSDDGPEPPRNSSNVLQTNDTSKYMNSEYPKFDVDFNNSIFDAAYNSKWKTVERLVKEGAKPQLASGLNIPMLDTPKYNNILLRDPSAHKSNLLIVLAAIDGQWTSVKFLARLHKTCGITVTGLALALGIYAERVNVISALNLLEEIIGSEYDRSLSKPLNVSGRLCRDSIESNYNNICHDTEHGSIHKPFNTITEVGFIRGNSRQLSLRHMRSPAISRTSSCGLPEAKTASLIEPLETASAPLDDMCVTSPKPLLCEKDIAHILASIINVAAMHGPDGLVADNLRSSMERLLDIRRCKPIYNIISIDGWQGLVERPDLRLGNEKSMAKAYLPYPPIVAKRLILSLFPDVTDEDLFPSIAASLQRWDVFHSLILGGWRVQNPQKTFICNNLEELYQQFTYDRNHIAGNHLVGLAAYAGNVIAVNFILAKSLQIAVSSDVVVHLAAAAALGDKPAAAMVFLEMLEDDPISHLHASSMAAVEFVKRGDLVSAAAVTMNAGKVPKTEVAYTERKYLRQRCNASKQASINDQTHILSHVFAELGGDANRIMFFIKECRLNSRALYAAIIKAAEVAFENSHHLSFIAYHKCAAFVVDDLTPPHGLHLISLLKVPNSDKINQHITQNRIREGEIAQALGAAIFRGYNDSVKLILEGIGLSTTIVRHMAGSWLALSLGTNDDLIKYLATQFLSTNTKTSVNESSIEPLGTPKVSCATIQSGQGASRHGEYVYAMDSNDDAIQVAKTAIKHAIGANMIRNLLFMLFSIAEIRGIDMTLTLVHHATILAAHRGTPEILSALIEFYYKLASIDVFKSFNIVLQDLIDAVDGPDALAKYATIKAALDLIGTDAFYAIYASNAVLINHGSGTDAEIGPGWTIRTEEEALDYLQSLPADISLFEFLNRAVLAASGHNLIDAVKAMASVKCWDHIHRHSSLLTATSRAVAHSTPNIVSELLSLLPPISPDSRMRWDVHPRNTTVLFKDIGLQTLLLAQTASANSDDRYNFAAVTHELANRQMSSEAQYIANVAARRLHDNMRERMERGITREMLYRVMSVVDVSDPAVQQECVCVLCPICQEEVVPSIAAEILQCAANAMALSMVVNADRKVESAAHMTSSAMSNAPTVADECERFATEHIEDSDDVHLETNDVNTVIRLRCKHLMHVGCVYEWFQSSRVCPLCKVDLTASESIAAPVTSESSSNPPRLV